MAPIDFREIELVAVRIIESDERPGLAFIDNVTVERTARIDVAKSAYH
jgi:hypothetical protein